MKKRIAALLLALCLLLPTHALAAENPFVRSRAYNGQFSDLARDSVFYDNVSALYEYGLSNGRTDGTFGLSAPMTRGEIYIFAARIHSLYHTGDPEAGPASYGGDGGPLAGMYLRYLKGEGVLGSQVPDAPGTYGVSATRAEVAYVLSRVLPEEELPLINDRAVTEGRASGRFLTDVTESTLGYRDAGRGVPCWQEILFLYRTGISAGSGETGAFRPEDTVTRGAAAAMLTRLVDPSLRITLRWDVSAAPAASRPSSLAELVEPGAYIAAPSTEAQLEQSIRWMLSSGGNQLALRYSGLSTARAQEIVDTALTIVKRYCEQGYNSVKASFTSQGDITLTFSALNMDPARNQVYRKASLEAANVVLDQLWREGRLTEGMTETEKARVLFTWICDNCVYDDDAGEQSLSHIPYSLFDSGVAVCDGYTGAYNLLLKLEGISCTALANDTHIWTVAELDGTEVHIDTTWGDGGSRINYTYFAMTPEHSRQAHPW